MAQGVVDHGVLLDRVPQAMGLLDRLQQRARAAVDDVGPRPGRLGRLAGVRPPAGPAPGLAAHHHGHVGPPGGDGRQRLVDQQLLGDAQLGQVGAGSGGPDPVGHQASRVGIGPGPLGNGDPVDGGQQGGGAAVGGRRPDGPGHELGGLLLGRGGGHPHQHRDAPTGGPVPLSGRGHREDRRSARTRSAPADAATRRARSIRPTWRQVTGTAPRARASDRARSGTS